jgi:hypothetical protein
MNHNRIFRPLEKALRLFAVLAAVVVVFQAVGLLMYLENVWPQMQASPPSGEAPSRAQTLIVCFALAASWVRFLLWICIYWKGAGVLSLLRTESESPGLGGRVVPLLASLTWLLVASCILDVLILPAHFMTDVFLPFPISGWRLGVVEVARLVFPQAFGLAALVLAFLTHQYGQLLSERSEMKNELALTV